MLTKLAFQDFKSWQDTGDVRLAPLTALFGSNSSGKTSVLQMLARDPELRVRHDSRAVRHRNRELSHR